MQLAYKRSIAVLTMAETIRELASYSLYTQAPLQSKGLKKTRKAEYLYLESSPTEVLHQ